MRILFFTLEAYDMLTGGYEGTPGGAKLQQVLIGRELAARGHDVHFVEYDSEEKTENEVDGVNLVYKQRPQGSEFARGIQDVRETIRILREIDPDVCYRRVLDFEIIPLSIYCRLTDTRFVYGIAHDDELGPAPRQFQSGIKSTRLYRCIHDWALANADAIIAQNNYQEKLAADLASPEIVHLIPNCCPVEKYESTDDEFDEPTVLWVGRFQQVKQPLLFLELAENLPEVQFVMIGSANDQQLFTTAKERAAKLDNVRFEGYVPHAEIGAYFDRAHLLVNTAEEEGFPNTFLEAWAHETPVISLNANPDDVITEHNIGYLADGSLEKLSELVRELTEDTPRREKIGNQGAQYVDMHHGIGKIVGAYEEIIKFK